MLTSIILIIAWLFACYGLIVANMPTIKDEFDKIIPLQWVVGLILLLMGLWDLFMIQGLISLFENSVLLGLVQLAGTISKFVLWFVFTYGLLVKYVFTAKTDTKEKITKTYNTLVMVQVPFGIIALLVGIIGVVFNIIY
jgi:hypothetical protein